MWNPNETVGAWARDDDVLSWRSLDTLHGVEIDRYDGESLGHALSDSDSDTSDADELAEVYERGSVNVYTKPLPFIPPMQQVESMAAAERRSSPRDPFFAIQSRDSPPRDTQSNDAEGTRKLEVEVDAKIKRLQGELSLHELPSTSEMVSIREPPQLPTTDTRIQKSSPPSPPNIQTSAQELVYPVSQGNYRFSDYRDTVLSAEIDEPVSNQLHRPTGQDETGRRAPMSLGDLLAKRKVDTAPMLPPPLPFIAPSPTQTPPDGSSRIQELRELERRCEELQDKERHLQTVLAKQFHQLESLSEQVQQKDGQLQVQVLEMSGLKEQIGRLEKQNANYQASLREKDQAHEQSTQLLLQKTNEISTMETKLRSLQVTNESFQEQAKKAIEDKDKVQKDYLQVVYELGKLQKQMNAAAKETGNVAEKDLLLREIDQLRHEKDQLAQKLKDADVRKLSLQQSSSVVELQRQKELQARVRELEDELYRARNLRPAQAPLSQSASMPSHGVPSQPYQAHAPPPWNEFQHSGQVGMPSLMHGIHSSNDMFASGARQEKPMTLKDMMSDRRPPPAPSSAMSSSNSGSVTSLSSLGFSGLDRRSNGPTNNTFDFEQFKADALARRSDVAKQQQSGFDPYDSSLSSAINTALLAPFATEKQSLLQDSLQKRDLEQKLLKFHVEKEQTEAKLAKVEQSGLKTMSARTEKAWLESRLRDLTVEIGRLKLSLR